MKTSSLCAKTGLGILAAIFVAEPLAADEAIFFCHREMSAIFDTGRDLRASFDDLTTEKAHHHHSLSLNLTKKQIGYVDDLWGKDVWLDVAMTREGDKWIVTSPLIEYKEAAPEKATIYFDQQTHAYMALWRRYPETTDFHELAAVESGRCEQQDKAGPARSPLHEETGE